MKQALQKLLSLRLLLVTALMVSAFSGAWADDYELYSGDLTAGDYLVVYSGKALKASISSNRFDYGEVTATNDVISTTDASLIWTVAVDGSYVTLYNASTSKYAASNGTKNQAKLEDSVTDNSRWTVSGSSTYEFVNKANAAKNVNSNLRNNGTYGFACYSTSTGGALSLYKKKASDPSKQDVNLSFPASSYTANLGESFTAPALSNESGVTVAYSSSSENVATVDAQSGAVTIVAAGTTTITASFAGDDTYNSATASYTLTVVDPNANDGSEEHPYTVAEARAAIDAGTGVTGVYATGIVSKIVTAYNSQYGNISYNISEDGTEDADQLQAFRGFDKDGEWFTSEDDVQVGDIVVIYGNLKKYNSTYEFDAGNQRVSLARTSQPTLEEAGLAFTGTTNEYSITLGETFEAPELSNPNKLDVTYSSSDETVATVDARGTVTILAAGTTTITASSEANETFKAGTASYTITVTDPDAPVAETVEFDFTANDWGFPEGSTNKTNDATPYSNGTYTITVAGDGSNGYYYHATDNYLLFGKNGAYITLPAFDFAVQKIEVVGNSSASGNTVQNIFVGETAVSSETTGAKETNTYVIDEAYQAAGNIYTLKVTSAHNSQVTKIIVYKGAPDERLDAEIKFLNAEGGEIADEVEMALNDMLQVSISTVMTSTEGIVITSNNEKVATYEEGYFLALAEGTAKITATFAGNDVYKPATVTKTINVVDRRQEVTLSFNDVPASININETATYAATSNIADANLDITYTSDNEQIVMVGEKSGEIAAIAVGSATITATFAGNDSYKAATASYTIEVVDPSNVPTYYALVADLGNGAGKALTTSITGADVDIVNGKVINGEADNISWVITAKIDTKVKIDSKDGKHLAHSTGNKKTDLSVIDKFAEEDEIIWESNTRGDFGSYNGRDQAIQWSTQNSAFKNYAGTSNGYYAAAQYTFADGYTREVTGGNWGTICLPNKVSADDYAGVKFYLIAGKTESSIVLMEAGELRAGVAYIFQANEEASKLIAAYSEETANAPVSADDNNGLGGSFTGQGVDEGMFLISNNKVVKCGTGCSIAANRAYIDMTKVPEYNGSTAGVKMLGIGGDIEDGINAINGEIRSGVIYNVAGQRMQRPVRGINIINGQKVLVK